ncbi:hypothetical protein GCM10025865_14210 [Paraoerskovia sediminicola]|uniref:Uncharacterized protein n=1 Tax=Paraoerskovia sediminicola TaxID=1138587 RepID=A0ABN6XEK4_9CELL|nr:hypothetical protein [Paraoerskovia sediminicola]BDZ42122.1 hypothetical protein GCM10025865_14210 [Paraoerskovia sediminicola]
MSEVVRVRTCAAKGCGASHRLAVEEPLDHVIGFVIHDVARQAEDAARQIDVHYTCPRTDRLVRVSIRTAIPGEPTVYVIGD